MSLGALRIEFACDTLPWIETRTTYIDNCSTQHITRFGCEDQWQMGAVLKIGSIILNEHFSFVREYNNIL